MDYKDKQKEVEAFLDDLLDQMDKELADKRKSHLQLVKGGKYEGKDKEPVGGANRKP